MEEVKKEKMGYGGARPGAGRKPGSTNKLTADKLLDQVRLRTNGQNYEELLVEDFIAARFGDDKALLLKYHNLILNKVMDSLAKIEITESEDAVEAKKIAFADALAKLAGMNPE
jgi:hypothetical protein